ncbi:MAG: hypothetical protein LUH22_20540 [Bacteroides sp.]|nr:hypothetical protein [Bacteroides sp.]
MQAFPSLQSVFIKGLTTFRQPLQGRSTVILAFLSVHNLTALLPARVVISADKGAFVVLTGSKVPSAVGYAEKSSDIPLGHGVFIRFKLDIPNPCTGRTPVKNNRPRVRF